MYKCQLGVKFCRTNALIDLSDNEECLLSHRERLCDELAVKDDTTKKQYHVTSSSTMNNGVGNQHPGYISGAWCNAS